MLGREAMAKKSVPEKSDRKELLRRMSAPSTGGVVEKVVHFTNNDVPSYLEGLRQFEKESRETQIIVK